MEEKARTQGARDKKPRKRKKQSGMDKLRQARKDFNAGKISKEKFTEMVFTTDVSDSDMTKLLQEFGDLNKKKSKGGAMEEKNLGMPISGEKYGAQTEEALLNKSPEDGPVTEDPEKEKKEEGKEETKNPKEGPVVSPQPLDRVKMNTRVY